MVFHHRMKELWVLITKDHRATTLSLAQILLWRERILMRKLPKYREKCKSTIRWKRSSILTQSSTLKGLKISYPKSRNFSIPKIPIKMSLNSKSKNDRNGTELRKELHTQSPNPEIWIFRATRNLAICSNSSPRKTPLSESKTQFWKSIKPIKSRTTLMTKSRKSPIVRSLLEERKKLQGKRDICLVKRTWCHQLQRRLTLQSILGVKR